MGEVFGFGGVLFPGQKQDEPAAPDSRMCWAQRSASFAARPARL